MTDQTAAKDETALTEQEKRQIIAHITEKSPQFACSVCHARNFSIGDHIVTPTIISPTGGIMLGGTSYPMVITICTKCFHVVHFASVPMGLRTPLPSSGGSVGNG